MFAIGRLLAILSAMIVIPTVSYVLGETTADAANTPTREDRPVIERRQEPEGDRAKQERFFGGPNGQGAPDKNSDTQNTGTDRMMFLGNDTQNTIPKEMMQRFDPKQLLNDTKRQNAKKDDVAAGGDQGKTSTDAVTDTLNSNDSGDAAQEARDAQMEKRKLEQEKRQLEQMKKGLTNMKRPLAAMKSKMGQLEKSGVTTPSDIKKFVGSMEQAMATIQSAQTFEEAQDAMDTLQSGQQDFKDNFQTLQVASNWPKILKQANTAMKGQEKMLAKFIRDSKRKGALDISEPLGTFSQAIVTLKTTLASAQEKAKTGDIEEAISTLQDDFFGAMDDLRDTQETIMTLTNLTQYLTQTPRRLKLYESQLNALKKKKVDTQEADQTLVQLKGTFSAVKALSASKPVDPDAVSTAVEEGSGFIEKLEASIGDLSGTVSANDQLFQVNEQSIPKFDLGATSQ